jgi:hypothetical protein
MYGWLIVHPSFYTALVNDAFSSSETEGTIAYWKLLSEVIAGRFLVMLEVVPRANSGSKKKKKKLL